MVDPRAWTSALALVALCAVCSFAAGCRAPIAVAEVLPVDYEDVVRSLPEGSQGVELLIDGETILRGAFVPPAPNGPLVVHLLESGGSVARGRGGRGHVLRQLADLGIGSLMLDWSGVGVSSGTRKNEHLRRDASVMWREALRHVDGDPSRLIIRSTSLGTLAAAGLIERGAKPGALIMIAPIRGETAHKNFARERYGSFFGGLMTTGMGPLVDVDLLEVLRGAPCPMLVIQAADGDVFVSPEEHRQIESATSDATARFGRAPGAHVEVALRARSLSAQELSFLEPWLPPMSDAAARATLLQTQMPGGVIPSTLAEDEVQRRLVAIAPLLRTQPTERIVAAGLASTLARKGARLLWLVQGPDGELPRAYDGLELSELVDVFSLDDPAGELPLDLIARFVVPYRITEDMGGVISIVDATDLPAAAWAGGAGTAGATWTSWMNVPWLGAQGFSFDHAALWRSLLERGLDAADARRQMVRVLLFVYGHAHRLRQTSAGDWALEVWENGAWVALDLETAPKSFQASSWRMRGSLRGY